VNAFEAFLDRNGGRDVGVRLVREVLQWPAAQGGLAQLPGLHVVREAQPAFRPATIGLSEEGGRTRLSWMRGGRPALIELDLLQAPAEAAERIRELRLAGEAPDTLKAMDGVFDPLSVGRRFAAEFVSILREAAGGVELLSAHRRSRPRPMPEEAAAPVVARHMVRLCLVLYLQGRGWLRWQGRSDYLQSLYRSWQASPRHHDFGQLASHLFFSALGQPSREARSMLTGLIGDVPFLGGGLFEPGPFESALGAAEVARFPASMYERLLGPGGLADRFPIRPPRFGPGVDDVCATSEAVASALDAALDGHPAEPPRDTRARARAWIEAEIQAGPDRAARLEQLSILVPECGSGAMLAALVRETAELRAELGVPRTEAVRRAAESVGATESDPVRCLRARVGLAFAVLDPDEGPAPRPLPDFASSVRLGRAVQAAVPKPRVEDAENEFKAAFEWNPRTRARDPKLREAAVRAVAAFLNTRGGTLWLGVSDSGAATGLEEELAQIPDSRPRDVFELKFHEALKQALEPIPVGRVRWEWLDEGGATLAQVHVEPAPGVTYVVGRDPSGRPTETVYARDGARTIALTGRHRDMFVVARSRASLE
jgi:hypothetical protein